MDLGDLTLRVEAGVAEERWDDVADLVLRHAKEVIDATSNVLPPRALTELRIKQNMPRPHEIRYQHMGNAWVKFLERHSIERMLFELDDLLIEDLWEHYKEPLEELYSRNLASFKDFKIMNGIYEERAWFGQAVARMETSRERVQLFHGVYEGLADINQVVPNIMTAPEKPLENPERWKTVADIWRFHNYIPKLINAAGILLDLVDYAREPELVLTQWQFVGDEVERVQNDEHLNFPHFARRFPIPDTIPSSLLEFYTKVLVKGMGFYDAISLVGASLEGAVNHKVPRNIQRFVPPHPLAAEGFETLARSYRNHDPECADFIGSATRELLQRWQATAVDHERIFDTHEPQSRDAHLIAAIYTIKDGEPMYHKNDRVMKGRLPAVLDMLVHDGYLQLNAIQPPVEDKHRRSPDSEIDTKTLDTLPEISGRPLLAAPEESLIPVARGEFTLSDFAPLEKVLEAGPHYLLYQGRSIAVMASMDHFPSGSTRFNEFYVLKAVASGRGLEDVVELNGQQFTVNKAHTWSVNDMGDLFGDVTSDVLPVNSYTVVVNATPEEFSPHYRDFLAQALIFRPHIEAKHFVHDYETIDDFPLLELSMRVGVCAHTYFRTFEVNGNFAFNIRADDHQRQEDVVEIGKALSGYLVDAGFSFRHETALDEMGRDFTRMKNKGREFREKHLDEIIEALQGNGLADALSFALESPLYSLSDFGPAEPCSSCGQQYIAGSLYRPSKGEQWIDGVDGADLHALANHPDTFTQKWNGLQAAYDLLAQAEHHEPVFAQHPEILSFLDGFADAYGTYIKHKTEAFSQYLLNAGDIDKEKQRQEDESHKLAVSQGRLLHQKYEQLLGERKPLDDEEVLGYWGQQLMIYNIYLVNAPKMLPDGHEKTGLTRPIPIMFS